MKVHHTSLVSPEARLGENVTIGPYSIIESGVVVGAHTEIREHVIIRSGVSIGTHSRIHPFTVVGEEPQHLKYQGEPTLVKIGNQVTLREGVTVHRGTVFGRFETTVGDGTLIMAYSHVAHDCVVGNDVILANAVQLAGHVEIGSGVTIGGHSAVAQFLRIGSHCYIGGGSVIRKDVLPFLLGKGSDFEVQGVNTVGLTRKGFSDESIRRLRSAYRILFLQKLTVPQALEKISVELGDSGEIREFLDFIKMSKNGFHR